MAKSSFDLSLYLCTYNVCTRHPNTQELPTILGLSDDVDSSSLPDIYGICLQEVNAKPHAFLKDKIFDDPWTNEIRCLLHDHDYVKIRSERLQGIVLLLFTKRYHVTFLRDVKVNFTRTGLAGLWGNKGGVTLRFTVYSCTVCIIGCHLAAHDHRVQDRLEDHDAILDGLMFRDADATLLLDHDYVFWIGDLNFRVDLEEDVIRKCIEENDYDMLWKHDQLLKCIKQEDGFHWFTEGPLNFPPTYKFTPGTSDYDKRRPAWCDRILWLVNDDRSDDACLALKQKHYQSHPSATLSDHKPVTSAFTLSILCDFNEELVKFHPVHRWYLKQDATCVYTVREYAETSTWDWVGFYKSDFSSMDEYLTYLYAVPEGERKGYNGCQLTLAGRQLTQAGWFRLCYISSKRQCILGMSRAFQVVDGVEEEMHTFSAGSVVDEAQDLLQGVGGEAGGSRESVPSSDMSLE